MSLKSLKSHLQIYVVTRLYSHYSMLHISYRFCVSGVVATMNSALQKLAASPTDLATLQDPRALQVELSPRLSIRLRHYRSI